MLDRTHYAKSLEVIGKEGARPFLMSSMLTVFLVGLFLALPQTGHTMNTVTLVPFGNNTSAGGNVPHEMEKVSPFEFRGDLRNLPYAPVGADASQRPYRPLLKPPVTKKYLLAPLVEPQLPSAPVPLAPMPGPIQNFAGLNFADSCGTPGSQCGAGWPPDPNGDIGLNHYIEAVNEAYAIYSKNGALLASFTENQLWSAGGTNPCNGNSQGDPIVIYDPPADRWILTYFAFPISAGNPASPMYQCIAVSKTSDPVAGGWWLYPLRMDPGTAGEPPVGALNDYPKFGIWTDCLYMAANEFIFPGGTFAGTAYASFSRSDMYSGLPLTWSLGFINNTTGPFTMIPSNLRGAPPPTGTPNYFVSESTTEFFFEVRKFTAGANCGSGGSLGAPVNVSQAAYNSPDTGSPNFATEIIPQPGTTTMLDAIGDRLMQKVQYRKVGAAESLWVTHTVRTGTASSTTGSQWAQINVTGGTIATTPVQQQIYAPDATLYRWMGSLAVDKDGNMALGYSTANGTSPNFPSIAYSGRLAADPLNTLPQTETQLIAGSGSQTNNCGGAPCTRWGDYSAMSVDPADDCTFWYINQFYNSVANGAIGNWQTRIGSFKFPSCGVPNLGITKMHTGNFIQGQTGANYTITVTNISTVPTSGTVTVTDTVPAGLTATGIAGAGWTCTQPAGPCARGDALAVAASYPVLTLTVNVDANAPATVTNTVTVANGGETNTANDLTAINQPPDLTITKTHTGNFTTGQAGATYTITVTNIGVAATSGTVTVTDIIPADLIATGIAGTGWSCTQPAGPCTRSDALAAAASYPALALTVNVASNAAAVVTNTATVAGGGETNTANDTANDPTTVVNPPIRIGGTTPIYYPTIQAAYSAAVSGDTIQTQAMSFTGNLDFNVDKSVTLQGGYDSRYTANAGLTTIIGTLTISLGTGIFENIIVSQ